jgi:hypothetical protein
MCDSVDAVVHPFHTKIPCVLAVTKLDVEIVRLTKCLTSEQVLNYMLPAASAWVTQHE